MPPLSPAHLGGMYACTSICIEGNVCTPRTFFLFKRLRDKGRVKIEVRAFFSMSQRIKLRAPKDRHTEGGGVV